MSYLNDRKIIELLDRKIIAIDPLTANDIQPASIDLGLHEVVELFEPPACGWRVSMSKEELAAMTREIDISSGFALAPGQFITGYSAQKIKIPSFISGRIYNRNSLAKLGLDAAISAFMNPGFYGRKVIVIRNFGPAPVILHTGMRVCQLQLEMLDSPALRSFEDRHNVDKLPANIPRKPSDYVPVDNSLSEFMNEQIKKAVARLPLF